MDFESGEQLAEHLKATAVKNDALVAHVRQMTEDRGYGDDEGTPQRARIVDAYVSAAMSVVAARQGIPNSDEVLASSAWRLHEMTDGFDVGMDRILLSMRNALGVKRKAPEPETGPKP